MDRAPFFALNPMECVGWAIQFPKRAVIALVIGALVGLPLGTFAWLYTEATQPVVPVLQGEMKVWRGWAGTIWIEGHYKSESPGRCLRQDSRVLLDGGTPDRPTYFELSSGQGGRGLSGSQYDYNLLSAAPADLPAAVDKWILVVRLHYACEPFGLVHWEVTLPLVPITIPPRGEAG